MNIEAFVLTVIIVFLAFAIGFAKGSETTVYNIRNKFRDEGYSYDDFSNVIDDN